MQGGACGGRQDGSAELNLELHSGTHQDEAADGIHESLQQYRSENRDRQHHERIHRAARQHAVRNLKQIKRYGEKQDVDGDSEQHHHNHVAAHRGDALGKACGEIDRFAAFMKAALAAATAAATAATIARWFLAIAATARRRASFVFTDRTVIVVDSLDEGEVGSAL